MTMRLSIQHGTTDEEALSTLAHELAPFADDDPCGEDDAAEKRPGETPHTG
jgi:hypothetical protein